MTCLLLAIILAAVAPTLVSSETHVFAHQDDRFAQTCAEKSDSLYEYMECFQQYIIPENSTDPDWQAPSEEQFTAFRQLCSQALKANSLQECSELVSPLSLDLNIVAKQFCRTPEPGGPSICRDYCLIDERTLGTNGKFQNGYGMFAVILNETSNRQLHFSAAHPLTDNNVHLQAAYATEHLAGVKSLTVTGATRWAGGKKTSLCQPKNGRTDAAHNIDLMFHAALLATKDWQFSEEGGRGCPEYSCVFLQFHGMRDAVCRKDDIFVAPGYANASEPVVKLAAELKTLQPTWRAATPVDGHCPFIAATNVFGRVLNGVSEKNACTNDAAIDNSDYTFVHIEAHYWALKPEHFGTWVEAVDRTFTENQTLPTPAARNSGGHGSLLGIAATVIQALLW